MLDSTRKALPSDVSAERDATLARRMMRVNVLPYDYDKCMDLPDEKRKEALARLHYKVC